MKKAGGNRLNIEDTGSEDEEEILPTQIKKVPILAAKPQVLKPSGTGKKQVKIAEVESDEDNEDEEEEETKTEKNEKENIQTSISSESFKIELKNEEAAKVDEAPKVSKSAIIEPPVIKLKTFELPKEVTDFKNKANTLYSSGNYADAKESFTKTIEKLNGAVKTLKSK